MKTKHLIPILTVLLITLPFISAASELSNNQLIINSSSSAGSVSIFNATNQLFLVNGTSGYVCIGLDCRTGWSMNAGNITAGTFASGDFIFRNNLTVGGNNFFVNNGTGNVGVGTTSPSEKLVIQNSGDLNLSIDNTGTGSTFLRMDRQTSGGEVTIILQDAGITKWGVGTKTNTNDFVIRENDTTERLFVQMGSGNIGLGTAIPGNVLDLGLATSGRGISWTSGATTKYNNIWSSFSDASLWLSNGYMPNSSNITPSYAFNGSMGRSAIKLDGFTGTSAQEGFIAFYTELSTNAEYGTTATNISERMRITPQGNLGINTTSPTHLLDVNGAINASQIELNDNYKAYYGSANDWAIFANGTNLYIDREVGSSNVSILDGNVGIRTASPTAPLHVKSAGTNTIFVKFDSSTSNNMFEVVEKSAGDSLIRQRNVTNTIVNLFDTAGNSYINGGNLGLGTTSPTHKLNVVGTSNFTGDMYLGNAWTYLGTGQGFRDGGVGGIKAYNTSGALQHYFSLNTGGSSYINNGGSLGINTTTPNQALQVSGQINATSNISTSTSINIGGASITWDGTQLIIK